MDSHRHVGPDQPTRVSLIALLVLVAEMTPMPALLAQTTPALIPDAGHAVSTSRGSSAKSFMIASKILNERRRIYVVLPASFAKSAPSRKYPVTIVLDGEDNMPPVAAVSDELIRNGQIPDRRNLVTTSWRRS